LEILDVFRNEQWLFFTAIVLFSLCVGSFLNVVIYRLPVMLETDWRQQCQEFLEIEATEQQAPQKFNLAVPASTCPHCGHKIGNWENIPLISYIVLGGKCSACKTPISIQYPIIEAVTAVMSVVVAWKFGVTTQTAGGLLFTWTLIALTMIDVHKQLLPDNLTLPLLWLGLVFALFDTYASLQASVVGAIAGYLVLWTVFQTFKLATGKEGMGFGDFKLLAALGAWMGWTMLPQIVLLSSVVGAIAGSIMLVIGKTRRQQPIPFGPYLAVAGWIALLWGNDINQAYLISLQ
jgi:leader peptidase (prepilin peptidase)/N-methyltransferase